MAARWMQAKVARMKPLNLRFVEAGTVKEARHVDERALDMPIDRHADDAIIATWLAQHKPTRSPCTGRMPIKAFGHLCKGHTRAGNNLNPISERSARERGRGATAILTFASVKRKWEIVAK